MTIDVQQKTLKAVLVGVQLPRVSDMEHNASLKELSRLVTTLGYNVIGVVSQRRQKATGGVVLGDGKLLELAKWTGGTGKVATVVTQKKSKAAQNFSNARTSEEPDESEELEELDESETLEPNSQTPAEQADVVIFDCDLGPSQLRNLESALACSVLDRTGVIIEIFSRHARTRAAKLQVEIARLNYVAPRLRETGPSERLGNRNSGETSVELDRRRIRDRVKELRTELENIADEHLNRRSRRSQENTVAIVGYTNAGKSSLMRKMTGSEVLVADKLFATLDTTVRALHPETHPRILLSDTVGFIKKLPHDLVASFRSTLDEALNAALLLHVIDCSSPTFRNEMEVTQSVLAEIGALDVPLRVIFNKKDLLSQMEQEKLQAEFPKSILISTREPSDIARLREGLITFFEADMKDDEIFVPYTTQGIIGDIRNQMRVLGESYEANGVKFRVRARPEVIDKLKSRISIDTAKKY